MTDRWPPMHFDRAGEPITFDRWGELFEDREYQRVALDVYPSLEDTALGDHPLDGEPMATVSTVWLGIDHGWGSPVPIIFETMIFGGPYNDEQMRYATEAQAVEGHRRVMDDLRAGRAPWWLTDEMACPSEDSEEE